MRESREIEAIYGLLRGLRKIGKCNIKLQRKIVPVVQLGWLAPARQ